MKVRVEITENFKKEAKPLLKRYASLPADLRELEKELYRTPEMGMPLGNNLYKIRLKISSKNKGKSGGARIISHVEKELIGFVSYDDAGIVVSLLSIYDKSDTATISDKDLKTWLNASKSNPVTPSHLPAIPSDCYR